MESIATWFKKERDVLYLMGQEEGIEQGKKQGKDEMTREVIKSLLLNSSHTVLEIAKLVNVPESLVLQVKESL